MTATPRISLFAQDTRTKRRNAAEARFRSYGLAAIVLALLALVWLLISIFSGGLPAFKQSFLTFPVTLEESVLDKGGKRDPAVMAKATTVTYAKVLAKALEAGNPALAAKGLSTQHLDALQADVMLTPTSADSSS